jgi:hypothetical protein
MGVGWERFGRLSPFGCDWPIRSNGNDATMLDERNGEEVEYGTLASFLLLFK